jgi:ACR3 family arsenite efflux pump ArsB
MGRRSEDDWKQKEYQMTISNEEKALCCSGEGGCEEAVVVVSTGIPSPDDPTGASNFFDGVLVEVPVMLSVCSFCNRTRHWFPSEAGA